MRAILYCFYDIFDGTKHKSQEVFIMPVDGDDLRHISSPVASRHSPLAKTVCHAIANHEMQFQLNGTICTILNYKVFDHEYINECKEAPLIDFTDSNKPPILIHVYKGKTSCAIRGHKVEDRRAKIINVKNRKPITISNIFYCPICKKYWIHEAVLVEYRKKGIFPANKFRYYDLFGNLDSTMQRESLLKQYGYNVQAGKLSLNERRNRLINILYLGALDRREIIDHLWFCIDMPGSRSNMVAACSKWSSDIRFVSDLPIKDKELLLGYLDKYINLTD